jgi:hypothetical protein
VNKRVHYLIAALIAHAPALPAQSIWDRDPYGNRLAAVEPEGNYWYRYTASDTVIVFVHGVNANAASTWMRRQPDVPADTSFWPNIVAHDPRFRGVGIYVAGYPADKQPDGGGMTPSAAIDRVIKGFRRTARDTVPVLRHRQIIFVTHSLGGIITRGVLRQLSSELRNTDIGLVLIASPANGSDVASIGKTRLGLWVSGIGPAARALLDFLERDNTYLRDLDAWSDSAFEAREFSLAGMSACEVRRSVEVFGVGVGPLVVDKESCARYFPPPSMMEGLSHSSIVKPPNATHPSHDVLANFYLGPFGRLVQKSANRLRYVDVAIEVQRLGDLPQRSDTSFALPIAIQVGDTLWRQRIPLSALPANVPAEMSFEFEQPSDTTVAFSINAATRDTLVVELRPRVAAPAAAGPSNEREQQTAALPGFTKPIAIVLPFKVHRSWIQPNHPLELFTTPVVHLSPNNPVWDFQLPNWPSREIHIRVVEPLESGTTTSRWDQYDAQSRLGIISTISATKPEIEIDTARRWRKSAELP